ncbi:MAG: transcription antitermination factor NusB [Gammaproteobacteria bacterium]|nr:transcription antitermination factor NusB [Gammaproteobacteria bacterium]
MIAKKFSTHARARARRTAVQALYQWEMTHDPVDHIIEEFKSDRQELKKADESYFTDLLVGVSDHRGELEQSLAEYLDRPLKNLDPVERAILCLAMYELQFRPEVPWRVIVNESIELAKMFGAEQSHRYINGVLDAAGRRIRAADNDGTI